ncbi:class I SAM-dependent methyltransferase [Nonomuraea sp. NPDC049152]|uniref:class I SAM-dependent DNA methyltransferase n=1 Tax=Nonomuraea sp. NPDC049152 TaxID=3154350 RepID=UPI0033EE1B0C
MTEPSYLHATRMGYDTIAADYAEHFSDELAAKPWDRALLAAFAEIVRKDGGGPVADLGCGPGRVTAHLDALGLTVFGVDLSPAMVAVARRTFPGLRFDEGSMTDLDLPDGALGGIVAWYSIINTPPEQLPALFAELHRVLEPGGRLLLAFQVGAQPPRMTEWLGHAVTLDFYWQSPDLVEERLSEVGLVVEARLVREPDGTEKVKRAYLLARRTGRASA